MPKSAEKNEGGVGVCVLSFVQSYTYSFLQQFTKFHPCLLCNIHNHRGRPLDPRRHQAAGFRAGLLDCTAVHWCSAERPSSRRSRRVGSPAALSLRSAYSAARRSSPLTNDCADCNHDELKLLKEQE